MAVLLAVYGWVGWSMYAEYKHILGGSQQKREEIMKDIDRGDLNLLPRELPPELQ